MGIHPTAIVETGARVHASADVGPFCVVGAEATIAEGTTLVAHVTVAGRTRLGARNIVQPYSVIGGEPQDLTYRGEVSEVVVGNDNVIGTAVTINGGTKKGGLRTLVGHRNNIGSCGHVAHDCEVEDDCVIGKNCLLAGHVRVGCGAVVGARTAVHHFASVGRLANIGMAGGISRDVPPFMRTEGYGILTGVNESGLAKSGIPREVIDALLRVFEIVWREGLPKPEALRIVNQEWGHVALVRELVDFLRATDRGRMGRQRDCPAPPRTSTPP
jgi:UDP-N-acetylglucosamine acyltransferase